MIDFTLSAHAGPWWIAGFSVLLAAISISVWWLEVRRSHRLDRFAAAGLLPRLVTGYVAGWRRPLHLLVIAGSALLLLAIAGPRWGFAEVEGLRGSREIAVVLDTSESMNAVNPPPNRLARARDKITALLDIYPADRFGLIAFSGAAALECPLTTDHAYFKSVLSSVSTDSLTAEGTDIQAALEEAEKLFESDRGRGPGASSGDRIVLLISDGEAVRGDAVEAAQRLAAVCRVLVMGIGDPDGAEVSLPQWMLRSRYAPGNTAPHWSVLDEEGLIKIALNGRGVYVRSTLSRDDLAVISRELALLDGSRSGGDPALAKVNRYRWPLTAAFVCFFAEGVWLVGMPYLVRRRELTGEAANALA